MQQYARGQVASLDAREGHARDGIRGIAAAVEGGWGPVCGDITPIRTMAWGISASVGLIISRTVAAEHTTRALGQGLLVAQPDQPALFAAAEFRGGEVGDEGGGVEVHVLATWRGVGQGAGEEDAAG